MAQCDSTAMLTQKKQYDTFFHGGAVIGFKPLIQNLQEMYSAVTDFTPHSKRATFPRTL
jgi:hypothetical protein